MRPVGDESGWKCIRFSMKPSMKRNSPRSVFDLLQAKQRGAGAGKFLLCFWDWKRYVKSSGKIFKFCCISQEVVAWFVKTVQIREDRNTNALEGMIHFCIFAFFHL